jgi:transposase InsO family protein
MSIPERAASVRSSSKPLSQEKAPSVTSKESDQKVRLMAKKAMLEAEFKLLEEQEALEKEELLLKQKKDRLKLRKMIATVAAEENAIAACGEEAGLVVVEEVYDQQDIVGKSDGISHEEIQKWIDDSPSHERDADRQDIVDIPSVQSTLQTKDGQYQFGEYLKQNQENQQKFIDAILLPKVELMTFDGNPLQYYVFWRAFESTVQRDSIDDASKVARLIHYCSGRAKNAIQCCAVMPPSEGFKKAKEILKERFGNDYLIAQAWLKKVCDRQIIKASDGSQLQDFADDLKNAVETLDAMKLTAEINVQGTLVKLIDKLPQHLKNRWRKEVCEIRARQRMPTVNDVLKFVTFAAAEAMDPVFGYAQDAEDMGEYYQVRDKCKARHESINFAETDCYEAQAGQVVNSQGCVLCNASHSLNTCSKFTHMTPEQRFVVTKDHNLCYNCLNVGHPAIKCRQKSACAVEGCHKRHATLLHSHSFARNSSNQTQAYSTTVDIGCGQASQFRVTLPIVAVMARSVDGTRCVQTLALLDSGSTSTLCTDELAKQLNLCGRRKEIMMSTIEQQCHKVVTSEVQLMVTDLLGHNKILLPSVYTRPDLRISSSAKASPCAVNQYAHLAGISFPSCDLGKVQILIGQDVPEALIASEVKKGGFCEPYASKTLLGWTVHGVCVEREESGAGVNYAQTGDSLVEETERGWKVDDAVKVSVNFVQADRSLEAMVEQFWQTEDVTAFEMDQDRTAWSQEDKQVIELWQQTAVHMSDGHYQLPIPFKTNRPAIQNNKSVALFRLQLLKKKLDKDAALKKKYTEFMEDMVLKGYAEKLPCHDERGSEAVWYLPHHAVTSKSKPDKVRVVLDCAAKYKGWLDLLRDTLPTERTLGIVWDVHNDMFKFKSVLQEKPMTRRGMLSITSSVYDPLGLVSPFILPAKLLIQEVTKARLPWDDVVPDAELQSWQKWLSDLPFVEQFKIARSVSPQVGKVTSYELHHFCDASARAYGVVTYVRAVSENGVHCTLLMAKSRLAPIRAITIPRLELMAAAQAVKQDQFCRRELALSPLRDSTFWTDSMIVLSYINNPGKRYQVFVANRLSVIHAGSRATQWWHVGTKENPADHVSRGMTAQNLVTCKNWVQGPLFLWQEEGQWSNERVNVPEVLDDDNECIKGTNIYVTEVTADDKIDCLLHRYSSWYKLKRSVAWLLRLKARLRSKCEHLKPQLDQSQFGSKFITVTELREAERAVVQHVQRKAFVKEIEKLRNSKFVAKTSALYKLCPILDAYGMLRVHGRLARASVNDDIKHPIILPNKCHVTSLFVRQYHAMLGHAGKEHVLSSIREKYWIIKGRSEVRAVLRECVLCKQRLATACVQQMADLPEERVTANKPPFTCVGLDYFGPIEVKRGRTVLKRYGCVFTCLSSRAVHIEVANSLETDCFIQVLLRFIARRGKPEVIRSDNGSNFVGAKGEVRKAMESWNAAVIDNTLKQRDIQWIMNPPGASHMGGSWERQIRTIRSILFALCKEQLMDEESLPTLMCLVESIINSRPLTTVSDDVNDFEALTPNHILLLRSGNVVPFDKMVKEDSYRRRWRHVQYLADVFWQRWLKEYLPSLQQRTKWQTTRANLKQGDVVMVLDEHHVRGSWPLGRILEVQLAPDGLVRSALVKTRATQVVRPVTKLCLLESVP